MEERQSPGLGRGPGTRAGEAACKCSRRSRQRQALLPGHWRVPIELATWLELQQWQRQLQLPRLRAPKNCPESGTLRIGAMVAVVRL